MDFRVEYNTALNSIIASTGGPMTFTGISQLIDKELQFFEKYPDASLVSDHTQSSADTLSADDIWKVSQDCLRLSDVLAGKKLAVVLVMDLDYGLGRMWKSFTEVKVPFEIGLFRKSEEALKWIVSN